MRLADLDEKVIATFYDEEHEEWSQQTVTIADVLDSVCDEYTVLQSAQPERKKGKWEEVQFRTIPYNRISKAKKCSVCGKRKDKYVTWNFCPSCGARMEGESDEIN